MFNFLYRVGFSSHRQFSKTGFTLMEILVVIAILVVGAGISFGAFRALYPSFRLDSVARDLTTDIRSAQQSAVTEQINYGVHFSTTTQKYEIIKYTDPPQLLLSKSFPQGIEYKKLTFSQNEVRFNPYGAVDETGEVVLGNEKGETKTIEVRPSGFVKIK